MSALDLLPHAAGGDVKNFIGGAFVPARSGETLEDLDPARGQLIARFPRSAAADVEDAVQAANAARAGAWGKCSESQRADMLDAIADGIEARL